MSGQSTPPHRLRGADGLRLFLGAEAAIYAAILSLDLWFPGRAPGVTVGIKYAGICLCLAYALATKRRGGADGRLLLGAMLLTALADLFLLLREERMAGVLCFCLVQGVYFWRLRRLRRRGGGSSLYFRGALAVLALVLLESLGWLVPLVAVAAVYFANLLCTCGETVFAWREGRASGRFALGMGLFLLCDICVGLQNAGSYAPVAVPGLATLAGVGIWMFYLPAQVLLVTSGLKKREKEVFMVRNWGMQSSRLISKICG